MLHIVLSLSTDVGMREKGSYYFIYKRTPKRRKLHFWEIFPDKFLVCGWRWPLVLETSNQLNTICAFIQFWLDLFRLKFRLYDMYFFYSFPDLFYWLIYATSFQAWLFTGSCDSMEGLFISNLASCISQHDVVKCNPFCSLQCYGAGNSVASIFDLYSYPLSLMVSRCFLQFSILLNVKFELNTWLVLHCCITN